MKLFWELVKRSFQRQMSYRAATVAGLATNFAFGLLRAVVLIALYGQQTEVAGITLKGVITYTAITQAVIGYMSLFRWTELMDSVYDGSIGSDLLKPMNFFFFWLAKDLGRAISSFLTRGLTIMLAYAVTVGITSPDTPAQWVALALAVMLSWLISFAYRFVVNLTAFWTPNAIGITRFVFVLSWALSGFLMPLDFFPKWFVTMAHLTPFPQMVNSLVRIYLGTVSGPELIWELAAQLFWATALIALGQVLLRIGVRRLVIQGG
jgi:ABC-2 type transport system permease protein